MKNYWSLKREIYKKNLACELCYFNLDTSLELNKICKFISILLNEVNNETYHKHDSYIDVIYYGTEEEISEWKQKYNWDRSKFRGSIAYKNLVEIYDSIFDHHKIKN